MIERLYQFEEVLDDDTVAQLVSLRDNSASFAQSELADEICGGMLMCWIRYWRWLRIADY